MSDLKAIFLVLFFSLICSGIVHSQSDFYDENSVHEVRIYFSESNWDQILDSLHEFVGEDGRLEADVMIDGTLLSNAGVRYKGYSSYDPDAKKSPFNIDLEYHYDNQNYHGYTKLKLSNVIQDPSFVREVLSYEIVRKYMPASRANYANVYVNDTLLGLYTNIEAVNKDFAGLHFGKKNNSFFKGDPEDLIIPYGQNANLAYQGNDAEDYVPYFKLESDDAEQSWDDLVRFIDILNNDTAHIDTILNVDRALWMHALNYVLVNLDSYIGYSQNYYLYMDDYGRFNTIMWDFNMSFACFKETDGITAPPGGLTIVKRKALDPLKMLTSTLTSPRPLIVNLLQNSTRRKMFLAHMRTIVNENFRNDFYLTRGQELQGMIDTFVQADPFKFYPYAQFQLNLDTTVGSGNNIFPGLRDLMEARVAYLDTCPGFAGAPVITDILYDPVSPAQGETVWITARLSGAVEAWIGYRYKTAAPFLNTLLFDDGQHHDSLAGDGIYGAAVTAAGPAIQFYIYAQNDSSGIFSPERAEYEFYSIQTAFYPGSVVINEFMALNTATVSDQDGDYDAWIEIGNLTSEAINLKGLYLTNDRTLPSLWAFPDTVLPANSYLIVWTDGDTAQAGLHTGFEPWSEGGNIYLFNESGKAVDSMSYGLQVAGRTYGRYPNGYGPFVYMEPTFARNNFVAAANTDFVLFPNPAAVTLWVELHNPADYFSYKVFNSTGQQVIAGVFNEKTCGGQEVLSLDISGLIPGLYVFKAESTDHAEGRKFLIIR